MKSSAHQTVIEFKHPAAVQPVLTVRIMLNARELRNGDMYFIQNKTRNDISTTCMCFSSTGKANSNQLASRISLTIVANHMSTRPNVSNQTLTLTDLDDNLLWCKR